MNNNFFTCIGKGYGAPCLPATREDWEQLRREPWLKEMCVRIKNGQEQLKQRLPVWTPHCAEFANNHRAIADAVKPLNRLMLDFDEKGHTIDILSKLKVKNEKSNAGALTVLLVEESVRGGTHVLVELPEGMSAGEAQELMKEVTGFEPDKAVKDVSRCIYMVTEDHTKYINDKLWTPMPAGESVRADSRVCPPSGEGNSLLFGQTQGSAPTVGGRCYHGIPYSNIVEAWLDGKQVKAGDRHRTSLILADHLRYITDNDGALIESILRDTPFVQEIIKERGENVAQTVKSAQGFEFLKGIPKRMQQALRNVGVDDEGDELEDAEDAKDVQVSTFDLQRNKLPIGLKESLKGVPQSMFLPVICSVLPIAGAYADGIEVEYCDGNRQKLGLMALIRGEQASGKTVCKNAVDIWKRQFDEEDSEARRIEEEWKSKKKARKANEKAPDDPHVLIRSVPVTISCSTLLKRLKNAQGHTLYSFCEELDTLRKTNGAGSWSAKYDIYRLGFDQGEWGQDYNSDAAESGVVKVGYNWTILGTDGALRKCFKQDNVENGLSSRVLPSEMPDASFSKMPKFGKRSEEEEARIQEAVTKLRAYKGFVDTPRLRRAVEKWVEEKRVEAAKDFDRVKDVYRKRAAVIGFRCGVIHHLLSSMPVASSNEECLPDNRESKATIDFALLMAQYCMEEQIKAFGATLEKSYVEAREECQHYGANNSIFDQLAVKFNLDDLRELKAGLCSNKSLHTIIYRWCKEGWIKKVDSKHWQKVDKIDNVTKSQSHKVTLRYSNRGMWP